MFFGEMALLSEKGSVRNSSVLAQTNLMLAVLSKDDFKIICENYPGFKASLEEVVASRSPRKSTPTLDFQRKKKLSVIEETKRESKVYTNEDEDKAEGKTKRTQTTQKEQICLKLEVEEDG